MGINILFFSLVKVQQYCFMCLFYVLGQILVKWNYGCIMIRISWAGGHYLQIVFRDYQLTATNKLHIFLGSVIGFRKKTFWWENHVLFQMYYDFTANLSRADISYVMQQQHFRRNISNEFMKYGKGPYAVIHDFSTGTVWSNYSMRLMRTKIHYHYGIPDKWSQVLTIAEGYKKIACLQAINC